MSINRLAVLALFPTRLNFEYAICELKTVGFKENDISAILPHDSILEDSGPDIPEYVIAAMEKIGTGEREDSVTGTLVRSGFPQREANSWREIIGNGGILMLVHCENRTWAKKALESLRSIGAEGICSTGEGY